jgi:hypothetical protein
MREYRQSHRAIWTRARQVKTVVGSILLLLVLGGAILCLVGIAAVVVAVSVTAKTGLLAIGAGAVGLGAIALVVYVFVGMLRRDVRFGPGWNRMIRLDAFANQNNLMYHFERRGLRYGGAIFSLGAKGVATDVMTVKSGRGVQIGNYRSFARSLSDTAHFRGGYVVIALDRRMPHMIAIAKKRRGRLVGQSIAPGLLRSQVLSLEGDFDKYFTLYAPKEYERDALYVFTPDLMVLLIDRLASYDLEIVDKAMYIYSHTPFDLLDPMTHQRLASIVQIVGHKATNQTLRYSDDRTAPDVDVVGSGGLRLRRGLTAGAIIAILYFAIRLISSFHGF